MKKLFAVILSALLALNCAAFAEADVDAVSSASTLYYFDGISETNSWMR